MSYRETGETLRMFNERLEELYQSEAALMVDVKARPVIRIDSFYPFTYESYGLVTNRGPKIVGNVALRAVLSAPVPGNENGVRLWAGVEFENNGYGLKMHRNDIGSVMRLIGFDETDIIHNSL